MAAGLEDPEMINAIEAIFNKFDLKDLEAQDEQVFQTVSDAVRKRGTMIRKKATMRKKRISRIEDIVLEKKESLSSTGRAILKEDNKKIKE